MDEVRTIKNKWLEKEWRDPLKHRAPDDRKQIKLEEDSTPLLKKYNAKDIVIKWNRANRIKTLRGIRR